MTSHASESMWSVLGLDPTERAVYEALLVDPGGDAGQTPAAVGVSPRRFDDAVERLVDLRLVRRVDDRIEVLEPRAALTALARQRQSVLDHVTDVAHDLGVSFGAARVRAEADKLYEVLRGRAEVVQRHIELINAATRSISVVSTPPFFTGRDVDTETALEAALARGVRIRVVYDTTALAVPELREAMESMAEGGEATRVLPRVVTRFVTVDGGTTLLPIVGDAVPGPPEPRALVVARSSLTDIVNALFERYWDDATPMRLGSTPPRSVPRLPPADQTLLNLLANGLPDSAIAHQLGCSDRTLRRRITHLCDLVGASSRFQLGMNAQARGWV